jgi:hypothetical protein
MGGRRRKVRQVERSAVTIETNCSEKLLHHLQIEWRSQSHVSIQEILDVGYFIAFAFLQHHASNLILEHGNRFLRRYGV